MLAVHINGSGMTHLVDTMSGEVLRYLSLRERTEEEIKGFVIASMGDPDVTWAEIVSGLLRPLEANGMLEMLD